MLDDFSTLCIKGLRIKAGDGALNIQIQKQTTGVFCRKMFLKRCSKNLHKIHRQTFVLEFLFNKVALIHFT